MFVAPLPLAARSQAFVGIAPATPRRETAVARRRADPAASSSSTFIATHKFVATEARRPTFVAPAVFRGPVAVKEISDASFKQDVLESDVPVLVDFYATWCGPCKLVAPLMDWAQGEYGDKLKVFKVEVDPNPESVKDFKVYGLPALLIFKDGQNVASHEGAISKAKLKDYLESNIPGLA
eukprot:tig00020903_g15110.t1